MLTIITYMIIGITIAITTGEPVDHRQEEIQVNVFPSPTKTCLNSLEQGVSCWKPEKGSKYVGVKQPEKMK